jgi:succinate-semialdehyde dehydrogenase/glutarate-semialdehyde dehydrogenase
MTSVNPATGEMIQTYENMNPTQLESALERAEEAYHEWSAYTLQERGEILYRAADGLRHDVDDNADIITAEMGKPIREARAEIEKCAWVCEYYAENANTFLGPELIETDARKSFVTFQPLGCILAVMPWNFPFWQVFRFAAPALMAGNVALLKHASNVPGCALAIEEIFLKAGCPEGVFTTLLVSSEPVPAIIRDSRIRAVTLTGSSAAGRTVAGAAGDALKKSVLELGGSDPYIVLEDAPLEQTVETCVSSRLINSGQSCIAAKRFVVVESVADAFTEQVVTAMEKRRVGDPRDESVAVGPLAREDLRLDLHRQVEQSIQQGAKCRLGGQIPEGPGWFYPPTVLTGVEKGMPAYDEEIFGPIASIIRVADEAHAIRVANDSTFGLGAAIFTADRDRGERLASREIQAGNVFVNAFVKSDPRLPFGGIKESGYGRELARYGIREFVNIKTVYVS